MNAQTELAYQRDQFYGRSRRSVPAARRFTEWSLAYWGLAEWRRAEDVTLCVSELATNALVHGVPPGRGFLLRLRYDGAVVRAEVHDSGAGAPRVVAEAGGDDAEGGRGLLLVSALADKWGAGPRAPGKLVWCEFVRAAGTTDGPPS
ncbi:MULTISPECIES: ATP-binding protein [unclassified Streptomyces]|uniref:ATP-binding protein n=1 Tax=unclassified Streptomyces TaxID=2593676 RepID=UPI00342E786D